MFVLSLHVFLAVCHVIIVVEVIRIRVVWFGRVRFRRIGFGGVGVRRGGIVIGGGAGVSGGGSESRIGRGTVRGSVVTCMGLMRVERRGIRRWRVGITFIVVVDVV